MAKNSKMPAANEAANGSAAVLAIHGTGDGVWRMLQKMLASAPPHIAAITRRCGTRTANGASLRALGEEIKTATRYPFFLAFRLGRRNGAYSI